MTLDSPISKYESLQMKTLGLIGGTSWHSTLDYYKLINKITNERLGGLHSARLILHSMNFHEFYSDNQTGGWESSEKFLVPIARQLEQAGAEGLLLCANTPHIVADGVRSAIGIPLIHIAEATAKEILKHRHSCVGLLGTSFTLEQPFYRDILARFGIQTLVPDKQTRDYIHSTIFEELGLGLFKEETKQTYVRIMEDLKEQGAQGIILGCTEIPLLIKPAECPVIGYDTTLIHATAAVDFALS